MGIPRLPMKHLLTSAGLLAIGVLGIWLGMPHAMNGEIVYGQSGGAFGAGGFYFGVVSLSCGIVFLLKRWRTASVIGLMLLGGIVGGGMFGTRFVNSHRELFLKGSDGPTAEQSREMAVVAVLGFVVGAAVIPAAVAATHALRKHLSEVRQTQ